MIELVKSLTQRDSDEKPKVKEADHIKLNDMHTPETYRQWKHHVRDEIKSHSDKPDAAWDWLMEVYNTVDERSVLEDRLSSPGKFTTLDTKLAAALTRSAKGDLANRIINYKEEKAKLGIQVRGRMIVLMFDDYFKTSEEAGSLCRVEDLLNCSEGRRHRGGIEAFHQPLGRYHRRYARTTARERATGHLVEADPN